MFEKTEIPNDAKRVFHGVLFDVYQWQQEQFDGSMATWERVKRMDSVSVIAVHEGKMVVAYEEHPATAPFTGVPCGFIEDGETPLETAKRELREEAGLESDDWALYRSWPVGSKVSWNEHVFIARNCKKVGEMNLDPGEKIRIETIPWEEFLLFMCRDDFRLLNMSLHFLRLKEKGELDGFKDLLFS